jgi:multidrug resistance efflux pump
MALDRLSVSKSQRAWRSPLGNLVMVLISAGLLVWSWQFLRHRMLSVVSVDAVINGTLVDLKAPEEGIVTQVPGRAGMSIQPGEPLFVLNNDRATALPAQALISRRNQARADLKRAEAKLDGQRAILQTALADNQTQTRLESADADQRINQLQADLRAAQSRQSLAQLQRDRLANLRREGAIAQSSLDTAEADWEQRSNEVSSLEAQIAMLKLNRTAVGEGLTLSRTRSNYDPRLRLQELQLQITDSRAEVAALQQTLRDSEAEVAKAEQELQRKQAMTIPSPVAGVLWKLNAQEGRFLQRGESLGQVADCRQRWVDAIVDETAIAALKIGGPAEVQLTGAEAGVVLTGKISMIRSGMGRLAAGEDVASPTTPNLPRQAQIRVDLDPPSASPVSMGRQNPGDGGSSHGTLCYIGYTGRVTFPTSQQSSIFALFR